MKCSEGDSGADTIEHETELGEGVVIRDAGEETEETEEAEEKTEEGTGETGALPRTIPEASTGY